MSQEAELDRLSRRRRLAPFWVPLLMGLLSLFSMISRPGFAAIHKPDVVQLIGTGMCFGVALAALIAFFRGRSSL